MQVNNYESSIVSPDGFIFSQSSDKFLHFRLCTEGQQRLQNSWI